MVLGGEEVQARSKLPSLKSAAPKPMKPPAVVITDDSEAYPDTGGSISQSLAPRAPPKDPLLSAGLALSVADLKPNGVCATGVGGPSQAVQPSRESSAKSRLSTAKTAETASSDTTVETNDPGTSGENVLHPEGQPQVRDPRSRCCSEHSRRMVFGVLLTIVVAASWVGTVHLLKTTYVRRTKLGGNTTVHTPASKASARAEAMYTHNHHYSAPFFTTWFCTMWNGLFFPVYLCARVCCTREKTTAKKVLEESVQQFQEKGFTFLQFFGRCGCFCLLWVITNYMFVHSLRILDTTDVMALYASSVSFVYLLSWVVLHEQFVGIRIVAVILCNTGIALLAYMDGVTRTATLGGVVLAAAAAAGSAVYKVFFKKLIGEVTFAQLSLFFSLVGILNALLMWPFVLMLYFTSAEAIVWSKVPWPSLGGAAALALLANLLGNFGVVWTYEIFLSLGLVCAVPASAIIDAYLYGVLFQGMKLAGILLISIGFFLVLLPNNWPEYITMVLRWRRNKCRRRHSKHAKPEDVSTGQMSRLRTPTGQVK